MVGGVLFWGREVWSIRPDPLDKTETKGVQEVLVRNEEETTVFRCLLGLTFFRGELWGGGGSN